MGKKSRQTRVKKSAEGYDLYAARYDDRLQFLDSFEKNYLRSFVGELEGKKVLDAGCGTGRVIEKIKDMGALVWGIDLSEKMLAIAGKKYRNVEFVQGDVEEMPFEEGKFDVVIASFLIVHLKELQYFFEEVYRVLKDGGLLILTNINQRKAPKLEVEDGGRIVIESFYHRPEDVKKALEEQFFTLEREELVYEGNSWINQILRARK